MIRVIVADDHDLLREGVSGCLAASDGISVVAEAPSGEGAVALVSEHRPDVVILDVVMPGIGGIEAARRIKADFPEVGVLALTSFSDRQRIQEALEAGADGYLIKSVDAESLARAVRSVALGQSTFSPEVTRALAAAPETGAHSLDVLTSRELEIADLVAGGSTNAEIASVLNLSIFTVKNHVSNVLSKLHAPTRTAAAAIILEARRGRGEPTRAG